MVSDHSIVTISELHCVTCIGNSERRMHLKNLVTVLQSQLLYYVVAMYRVTQSSESRDKSVSTFVLLHVGV